MRHLVIGAGEVGTALYKIIVETWSKSEGQLIDKDFEGPIEEVEAMHICFPYSEDFVLQVQGYMLRFNPEVTIIHSTVQVGTTALIGGNTAYSFVRGSHPNLANMTTYTKHIGALSVQAILDAKCYLQEIGFMIELHGTPDVVELGKLWDTTYYGICIAATKLAKEMADYYEVDFADIARMIKTYNCGVIEEGRLHLCRPELEPTPGPIGGHCVVPNAKILQQTFTSPLLDAIVEAK